MGLTCLFGQAAVLTGWSPKDDETLYDAGPGELVPMYSDSKPGPVMLGVC